MFSQLFLFLAFFSSTFAVPVGLYSYKTSVAIENSGFVSLITFIIYYQNRPFAKFEGNFRDSVGFHDYSTSGDLIIKWTPQDFYTKADNFKTADFKVESVNGRIKFTFTNDDNGNFIGDLLGKSSYRGSNPMFGKGYFMLL